MYLLSSSAQRKIALFAVILLSGGSLAIPRVPLLALIILLCLNLNHWKLTLKRTMVPVLILLGLVLTTSVFGHASPSFSDIAIRYANFIGALLLLNLYHQTGRDHLAADLRPMLAFMAAQSVLTIIIANIAPFLFFPIPAGGGKQFTFFLLLTYHSGMKDQIHRPDGFFWEPGVLQIYLNVYLYISLYVTKSRKEAMLALAGVASTLSTTGLVIAFAMLFASFSKTFYAASLRRKVTIFVLALLVIIPAGVFTYSNVLSKLAGENRGSFLARQFDLMTGIAVIAANPVLGVGFGSDNYLQAAKETGWQADEALSHWDVEDRSGNTNGVIYLLYSVGIPLSLPFLIGLYRQQFFRHRAMVFLLFILSLMSEPILLTPFPLLLIFDGVAAPLRKASLPTAEATEATA